jgi:hypothetical protein
MSLATTLQGAGVLRPVARGSLATLTSLELDIGPAECRFAWKAVLRASG